MHDNFELLLYIYKCAAYPTHYFVLNSVITIVHTHRKKIIWSEREVKWLRFISGWFQSAFFTRWKKKPKHNMSTERANLQTLCLLNEICFVVFNCIQVNRKTRKRQTNKPTWKTIQQAWIFRWVQTLHVYYGEEIMYCICRHCIKILRYFPPFLALFEKQIACWMLQPTNF